MKGILVGSIKHWIQNKTTNKFHLAIEFDETISQREVWMKNNSIQILLKMILNEKCIERDAE